MPSIAHCALGDAADIYRAVAAARALRVGELRRPRETNPVDRSIASLLHRLADLIERHADELANSRAIDNGKSWLWPSTLDIKHDPRVWRYMACGDQDRGQTLPHVRDPGPCSQYRRILDARKPMGVVGAGHNPWNFPFLLATWKCAPALAAGCTVVLKPSEEIRKKKKPLLCRALRLGRAGDGAAGFPQGRTQRRHGPGPHRLRRPLCSPARPGLLQITSRDPRRLLLCRLIGRRPPAT